MSINILERAIARLEELKSGATALPWSADHNGDQRNFEEWFGASILGQPRPLGNGGARAFPNLGTVDDRHEDADLIVALSRTVDPLLDAMRVALMLARLPLVDEGSAVVIANGEALARAVLGEAPGE